MSAALRTALTAIPVYSEDEYDRGYADGVAKCLEVLAHHEAKHTSDCAVHNEPAYPAGPCNCRV